MGNGSLLRNVGEVSQHHVKVAVRQHGPRQQRHAHHDPPEPGARGPQSRRGIRHVPALGEVLEPEAPGQPGADRGSGCLKIQLGPNLAECTPISTKYRAAHRHSTQSLHTAQHTVTAHSTQHTAHSTVTAHSHSAVTARSIEQRVMETARHGTAVTALVEASEERWVKLPSKVTVPTAPGRTASPMSSRSQTSATHRRICCANRETQSRGENGFVFCLSCDRTWRRCGLRKTWCAGDQGRGSAVPRGGGDLRRVGCKQKACWVG